MPSTAYLHAVRASPAPPPCVVAADGPACPSGMIACRLQASAGCYCGSSANVRQPFQLQACILPQGRYAPSPSQQPCQCANCRSFALASERPPMMRSTFARQSSKQLLHIRRCFCPWAKHKRTHPVICLQLMTDWTELPLRRTAISLVRVARFGRILCGHSHILVVGFRRKQY